MSRLTYKTADGRWGIRGVDLAELSGALYGAMCKLKSYEDTGLSPTDIEYQHDLIRIGTMLGGYKVIGCCNGWCVAENRTAPMPYGVWQMDHDGYTVRDGQYFRTRDEAGMYFTQRAWSWRSEDGERNAG